MKQLKATIITLNGYKNYGNRLQNLALSEVYKKKGCLVKTKWDCNIKSKIKNLIKCFLFFIPKYKRFSKFYHFSKKYIKETTNFNDTDFVIIGSDQVWNPLDALKRHELLGIGISCPIVAYSASFGVSNIKAEYKDLYKKGFSNISKVSVREEIGKKIFDDILLGKKPVVTIDPTLLLSSKDWDDFLIIPKKINSKNKYILKYFLGGLSNELESQIKKFARDNKYTIIDILDKKDLFYSSGPGEFLYLIKYSSIILTDSFHASVFSFIYNKPFIIYDRRVDSNGSMSSRLDTFISTFDLEDRKYIKDKNIVDYMIYDYTKSYKKLEKTRKMSNEFIDNSLKLFKN